jgi:hypothetical protein
MQVTLRQIRQQSSQDMEKFGIPIKLSLANMEKKYQVTFDSKRESAFTVHTEKQGLKFTKGPENLYYNKP